MKQSSAMFAMLAVVLLAFAGCGGGGGDDGNGNGNGNGVQQFVAQLLQDQTGLLVADPNGQNVFVSSTAEPTVGTIPDVNVLHREERGVLSFDLSDLPDDAIIQSAILNVAQQSTFGDPYGTWLFVIAHHINVAGNTLIAQAFNGFLVEVIGGIDPTALSTDVVLENKTLDVTDQVQNDLDQNRDRSQFRILARSILPTYDAGVGGVDHAVFSDGTQVAPPTIQISYTLP